MKTAISIPDRLFMEGEQLAKKLKINRSDLYQQALANYLQSFEDKALLAKINAVYTNEHEGKDKVVQSAQRRQALNNEWS